jgi:ribokinase
MMDIVGIGALNLDLTYRVDGLHVAGRDFAAGEETVGTEKEFSKVLEELGARGTLLNKGGGGSAANTIYALTKMGFATGYLGTVGKDDNGRSILESMDGVDVSRVHRYLQSGMCVSMLAKDDRSLLVLPNANDFFAYSEEDIDYLNESNNIHMGSFTSDSALAAQSKLMEYLDERVLISFAPGELYARRGLKPLRLIIARARIVFLSEREIGLMTGQGAAEGGKSIVDLGPKVVVCTNGDSGALIITKNSEISVPAKKTAVIDRTGAGDVFAAGFLAGYMGGSTLERSGEIGAAAAALSIASVGRTGYPDRRFIRRYLEAY